MSEVVKTTMKWDNAKISLINPNAVKGLFRMGFDMANQARRNAPYLTGALRNTIRVQETSKKDTLEVIAGGSYAGYKVDYAMKREEGPNRDSSTEHYMENAFEQITSGDYMKKYFGDII